ncbi:ABC transporter substrate-binding protein, partial [Amaricoccus solimangrovi]
PDSLNFDAGFWRRAVESVETPDAYTAVLHLKEQNVGLIYRLAVPFNGQVMLSAKAATADPSMGVGTGPWKMVEFRPGEFIRFEAVPNHWRQSPAYKELIIRQVPEESTRRSMIMAGQTDLAPVTPASARSLRSSGAQVLSDPRSYVLAVSPLGVLLPERETFDASIPWVADPADPVAWERALKVRMAMDLAIDRQLICDTLLGGEAVPAADRTSNESWSRWDPSWTATPYDPDRAKALLAEAGYPDGFEFPMMLFEENDRPGLTVMGQAVAQFWQAIGLRPKLTNVDYSTQVRPATRDRGLAGTVIVKANPAYEEPVLGYVGAFWSKAESILYAEYAPLDELIEKSLATSDVDQRLDVEVEMVEMVRDNHFVFPIAWVNGLWGASASIGEFPRISGVFGMYNLEYVTPAL